MRKLTRNLAAGMAIALASMMGTAAVATAETERKTPGAEELFAQLPPPPPDCYIHWDPIEDAIEDIVEGPPKMQVPQWADDWFDAFDDWCEGEND